MKGPGVLLLLLVLLGGGAGLVNARPAEDGENAKSEAQSGVRRNVLLEWYKRYLLTSDAPTTTTAAPYQWQPEDLWLLSMYVADRYGSKGGNATTAEPTNTTPTLQSSGTEESNFTASEVSPDGLVTSTDAPTPEPHGLLGNSSGTPTPEPHGLFENSSGTPTPEPHDLLVTTDAPTPEPHGLFGNSSGTPTPEPHDLLVTTDAPTPEPHGLLGNSTDAPTPEPHGLLGNSTNTTTPEERRKDMEALMSMMQDMDRLAAIERELEAKKAATDNEDPYARLHTRLREVFSTVWPYLPLGVFLIALVSCIVVCVMHRRRSRRCNLVHDLDSTGCPNSEIVI